MARGCGYKRRPRELMRGWNMSSVGENVAYPPIRKRTIAGFLWYIHPSRRTPRPVVPKSHIWIWSTKPTVEYWNICASQVMWRGNRPVVCAKVVLKLIPVPQWCGGTWNVAPNYISQRFLHTRCFCVKS